ncbi:MAG: hypothetical protein JO168_15110, partial [Solirubrobacterales bacterium]|nr:hypothetical protein [Solirubrobacterales bacterium]
VASRESVPRQLSDDERRLLARHLSDDAWTAVVVAEMAIMGADRLNALFEQFSNMLYKRRQRRDDMLETLRRAVEYIDQAEQAIDPITKGSRETIGPRLDRGLAGETPNH